MKKNEWSDYKDNYNREEDHITIFQESRLENSQSVKWKN